MSGIDILVTGGMGFIGRYTVGALEQRYPDAEIACLDNLSLSSYRDLDVRFIEGDVRDQALMANLIGETSFGVVHLAADSRVLPSLSDPDLLVGSAASNVTGTVNILTALAKRPHLRLVYAGSSTAYGGRPTPQSEQTLHDVQSPYSATKLAGELLIRSFVVTFGIRATVLRYFQVYGHGQPTTGPYALVTGVFARQRAAGEPLTIEGDGLQSRDFVHVTDVARANTLALEAHTDGLPINVGTGKSHTVQELADLISHDQVYLPPRRIDLQSTQATIDRARDLLGWTPEVEFADGIRRMLGA